MAERPRVTGIGGFFFKAEDPAAMAQWYRRYLGVPVEDWGGWAFDWRSGEHAGRQNATIWSAFATDTRYFDPSPKEFMFNFRVEDLDAMLAALRADQIPVDERIEESEFGRFGWCMDPWGHRIELWEPPVSV